MQAHRPGEGSGPRGILRLVAQNQARKFTLAFEEFRQAWCCLLLFTLLCHNGGDVVHAEVGVTIEMGAENSSLCSVA